MAKTTEQKQTDLVVNQAAEIERLKAGLIKIRKSDEIMEARRIAEQTLESGG